MVVKSNSRIRGHPRASTLYITIPSELAKDSNFPLHENDNVTISIENAHILIEKIEKG